MAVMAAVYHLNLERSKKRRSLTTFFTDMFGRLFGESRVAGYRDPPPSRRLRG